MISSVKLVESDGPALRFWARQARLITESLGYLLYMARSPAVVRVWLGVDEAEAREFHDELGQKALAAERAYETRESQAATRVILPLSRAHLIHSALLVSTRLTGSEEEYNIKVGFFKEHALDLADGLVAAMRQNEDATPAE